MIEDPNILFNYGRYRDRYCCHSNMEAEKEIN